MTGVQTCALPIFCLFLDICENTWTNYKKQPDFLSITLEVEKVIYNQKFAGAAADLLNPNIIARELGLADKQQNEHTGVDGKPIAHSVEIKVTFDD